MAGDVPGLNTCPGHDEIPRDRRRAARNFNVKRTARHLDLHTNTVYFRLNRIRELTGIDPGSYSGLSLLLTTVRMLNAGAKSDTIRR
jgi:hypothetical protein